MTTDPQHTTLLSVQRDVMAELRYALDELAAGHTDETRRAVTKALKLLADAAHDATRPH